MAKIMNLIPNLLVVNKDIELKTGETAEVNLPEGVLRYLVDSGTVALQHEPSPEPEHRTRKDKKKRRSED